MALTLLFAISGPNPSNDPHNGYCPHQNHYVPRRINNRYIKYDMGDMYPWLAALQTSQQCRVQYRNKFTFCTEHAVERVTVKVFSSTT
jgi:hypothetical protein